MTHHWAIWLWWQLCLFHRTDEGPPATRLPTHILCEHICLHWTYLCQRCHLQHMRRSRGLGRGKFHWNQKSELLFHSGPHWETRSENLKTKQTRKWDFTSFLRKTFCCFIYQSSCGCLLETQWPACTHSALQKVMSTHNCQSMCCEDSRKSGVPGSLYCFFVNIKPLDWVIQDRCTFLATILLAPTVQSL